MGKFAAKGTLLKIGSGTSPETFATVAHVTKIPGPENTRDKIDVTALDSAGGYKEYLGGLRDGGDVNIEGFFDDADAGQTAVLSQLVNDDVARNFQIVLPAAIGKTWTFAAFVTKYATDYAVAGAAGFTATLTITGVPVLA